MNRHSFALAAIAAATVLAGASTLARAADPAYDSSRQERMDSAYTDYQNNPRYHHDASDSSMNNGGGRFERGENSIKRGAHRAGQGIKNGAEKVGHAVETGAHKTGDALRRTGDKIKDKTSSNN
jgi:hypothetical protein